ncbi:MATE family efflux transporter [Lutibacter sp.]
MEQAKRVAKNTGFLYARMAITVFISLYVTRLVLAALGTEDFGTFNVVGGAIMMLTFLNGAMAAATQRFMSYAEGEGNHKKKKSIFNVSVLLHFIIAIVIVLLLEGAGFFLFDGILKINPERLDAAKLIYQFLIASTFFTIISVPYDAVINAHENMLFVAITGVLESFLKLGIAFYITYTNFDKLISYGFLMAALAILLLIIKRIYSHRKYVEVEINVRKYYDKSLMKEMTGFAGWSFLGSSSSLIANYGQGIVINMFFGTVVNAAQGISNQVSGQLSAFANTMMKALNPVLAKSEGAGNRALMIKASMMGSKVSFFLLTFFFIPILIEISYVFNVWLKEVPDFAVIFCQLLLLRNLIEQLFKTLAASISAHGKIRNYQIITSILSYFPLIVSYMLFSMGYSAYFLYIVFIIYSIIASGIILYFANINFKFPVNIFLKEVVLKCLLAFSLIYTIAYIPYYLLDQGLLRLCLVTLVSSICFLVVIWFVGFTYQDRKQIKVLINPILSKFFPLKF